MKVTTQILVSLIICVSSLTCYHLIFKFKIGYVNTGIVLSEYSAMKDADKKFEEEYKIIQSNIDVLAKKYNNLLTNYNNSSAIEKKNLKEELEEAAMNYEKYNKKSQEDIELRRQELTAEVVGKINKEITEYGKKHRYKIILGSTADGSLLYAKEADNITQVILELLNSSYEK